MNLWKNIFEEESNPVNIGIMIVLVIFGITILFWLFWSLMVYKGGLFEKVVPFILGIFGGRKFADYGYKGWHEQGLFEGWFVNLTALVLTILFFWLMGKILLKGRSKT